MSPQSIWVEEPVGLTSRRIVGNEKYTLKGSYTDSLAKGPSSKTIVCKATRLYVKETHLLFLKHLLEKQEPLGTLSRGRSGHHFWILLPCWSWCRWALLWNPSFKSLSPLASMGAPYPCILQLWPIPPQPGGLSTPPPYHIHSLPAIVGGHAHPTQDTP